MTKRWGAHFIQVRKKLLTAPFPSSPRAVRGSSSESHNGVGELREIHGTAMRVGSRFVSGEGLGPELPMGPFQNGLHKEAPGRVDDGESWSEKKARW